MRPSFFLTPPPGIQQDLGAPQDATLQSLLGTLLEQSDLIQNAPPPPQFPVPGVASPGAQAAATFSGTLASMLGAPGAAQNVQQQLQSQQAARDRTLQQNLALQLKADQDKQANMLQLLQQVSEAKMKVYDAQGRTADLEKEAKVWLARQRNLAKFKSDLDKEEEEAKIAGRVSVERVRGEERRKTSAARTTLVSANTPRARAILAKADSQVNALTRTSDGMRQQNERALSTYQTQPFSDEQIRIQENRERLEIDRIYMRALDELEGKAPKKAPPAAKPDINSFFTP